MFFFVLEFILWNLFERYLAPIYIQSLYIMNVLLKCHYANTGI